MMDTNSKKYFRIEETSSLLGVKPHVLRFWESEFPQVKTVKIKGGQRLYRQQDVDTFVQIQRLLQDKNLTIAQARKALSEIRGEQMIEQAMLESVAMALEPVTPAEPEIQMTSEAGAVSQEIVDTLYSAKSNLEEIVRFFEMMEQESKKATTSKP